MKKKNNWLKKHSFIRNLLRRFFEKGSLETGTYPMAYLCMTILEIIIILVLEAQDKYINHLTYYFCWLLCKDDWRTKDQQKQALQSQMEGLSYFRVPHNKEADVGGFSREFLFFFS